MLAHRHQQHNDEATGPRHGPPGRTNRIAPEHPSFAHTTFRVERPEHIPPVDPVFDDEQRADDRPMATRYCSPTTEYSSRKPEYSAPRKTMEHARKLANCTAAERWRPG